MTKAKKKRREPFTRLNIHERSSIEVRYCADKRSLREIAKELGRSPGTIHREIGGKPRKGVGRYCALRAQREAEKRIHTRGRKGVLTDRALLGYVREKMEEGWSPEQVSIRLPREFPEDTTMRVSHETIYTFIYAQIHQSGHGIVKPGYLDLRSLLPRRRKRRIRQGVRNTQKTERRAALPSIEERPGIEGVIGHWEGDTMLSRKSSVRVKSMNEKMTGLAFFEKTKDGTAESCDAAIIRRMRAVPPRYRKTLTQDRGAENRGYRTVEKELSLSCYFAHPYCSHERGSNENTNGLFRRCFPKGTDFDKSNDRDIAKVEYLLNTRPRKRLTGLTPYEVFYRMTGVNLQRMAYYKLTGVQLEV